MSQLTTPADASPGPVRATRPHAELRGGDEPLVSLLRAGAALGIGEIAEALGVTATAVRQRLGRLMQAGLVCREAAACREDAGRGRPAHLYRLTEAGRQIGGDNFRDLAMVLWREIRGIGEPSVRRGLLARIGRGLAEASLTSQQPCGAPMSSGGGPAATPGARLEQVAAAWRQRQIACECNLAEQATGGLPVLTSHTCPYPELAEVDRGICAAERAMLEELVAAPVRLTECRLDGDACCRFTVGGPQTKRERAGSTPRRRPAAPTRRTLS